MPNNARQPGIIVIVVALIGAAATITSAYIQGCFQHHSAAPAPEDAACRGLSSPDSNQPAVANFRNSSNRTVRVFWMKGDGESVLQFSLSPNGTRTVNTFVGHIWCVVDANSRERVQTATISANPQDIVIQ